MEGLIKAVVLIAAYLLDNKEEKDGDLFLSLLQLSFLTFGKTATCGVLLLPRLHLQTPPPSLVLIQNVSKKLAAEAAAAAAAEMEMEE